MNRSRCYPFPRCFQNTWNAKSRAKVAIDDQGPKITSQNPSTSVPFPFQRKLLITAQTHCSHAHSPLGWDPGPAPRERLRLRRASPSLEANPAPVLPPSHAWRAAPATAAQLTSPLPGLAPHRSALLRTSAPQPSLRTGVPCLAAHLPLESDNPASQARVPPGIRGLGLSDSDVGPTPGRDSL